MLKILNRYSLTGLVLYGVLLALCFKYGNMSQFGFLIGAPIVIGVFWWWMRSAMRENVVRCTCGGEVTKFAGHCPCGARIPEQSFEKRREKSYT